MALKSIQQKINRALILLLTLLAAVLLVNGAYFYLSMNTLAVGEEYRSLLGQINGIISLLSDYPQGDSSRVEAQTDEIRGRLDGLRRRLGDSHFSGAVSLVPEVAEEGLDWENTDVAVGRLGDTARWMGDRFRSRRRQVFRFSFLLGGGVLLGIVLLALILFNLRSISLFFFCRVLEGVQRLNDILSYHPVPDRTDLPRWREEEVFFNTIGQVEAIIQRERDMTEDYAAATLEEFLPRLDRLILQRVSFDRIALAFIDRLDNVIAESALVHRGIPELEPGFVSAMEETTLGAVAARREGRIIHDLSAHYRDVHQSEATNLLLKEGVLSSLTIPLVFRKNCIGFLFLSSHERNHFSPEDLQEVNQIVQIHKQSLYYQYLLQQVIAETAEAFVHLMEKKDNETSLHILRMARYSHLIAKAYHQQNPGILSPRFFREILWFAPLHDIGKIGIPDSILLKPAGLTPEEFEVMKGHVMMGEAVLQRMNKGMNRIMDMALLDTAIDIISTHHEKIDGTGYPRGMSGGEIPLAGRIVAAADVFDALTTRRPYKEPWPVEKALDVMREDTGTHFCPEVMAAVEEALPSMMAIYEKYKEV